MACNVDISKIEFYTYFPDDELTLRFVKDKKEYFYSVTYKDIKHVEATHMKTYFDDCNYISIAALSEIIMDGLSDTGIV